MTPKEYISQIDDNGVTYRMELGNCRKPHNHNDYPGVSVWWRPIHPFCIQDENGNTGLLGYESLQLYDTSTGRALGVVVPNTPDHDNYVPPTDTIVTDRYIMEGYVEDYYFEMETESTDLICPITGTLSLSMDSISIGSSQYSFFVDIESNMSWSVITTDIVSVDKTSGTGNDTIQVTVSANTEEEPRSGAVTVITADGNATGVVQISQEALDPTQISVSPTVLNFPVSGGSLTITVDTPQTWDFSESIDWANVTRSGDELTVVVGENKGAVRDGSINIQGDLTSVNVPVRQSQVKTYPITILGSHMSSGVLVGYDTAQEAISGNVSRNVYATSTQNNIGDGDIFFLDSSANTPIEGDFKWFRLGDTDVAVKIGDNGLFIESVDFTYQLSVSPEEISVGYAGGNRTIDVFSNTLWSVTNKPSWITIIGDNFGSGDGSINVHVTENTNINQRQGDITLGTNNGSKTAEVGIIQASAPTLSISPTSWVAPNSAGGSFTLNISVFGGWSIELFPSGVSGFSVSKTSGSGNDSVTVNVPRNRDVNDPLFLSVRVTSQQSQSSITCDITVPN